MDVADRPGGRFEEIVETAKTWWTFRGLVEVLAGAIAIAMPVAATLATTYVLAGVLLLAGLARIAHAFRVRRWSGFFVELLLAVLYVAAAVATFSHPIASTLGLTLVLGAWCVSVGVLEVIGAVSDKPPSWGWLVASGVASVVLGVMLVRGWPGTALWSIGLLVGATLIANGTGSLAVGLAPRRTLFPPARTV